ncbi:inner membrane-spanning protein YciB [Jannaschia aquimarina]|nr:septation protein IspZ [Jannaschia aquimarina]
MDRRLALELLPGIVFVAVNAAAGLFAATAAATVAAVMAVVLLWRTEREVPLLAVASVVLMFALLAVGWLLEDERFLKIRSTVGYAAFALFVAAGALMRPPLLARTLGQKLDLVPRAWPALHLVWAGVLLLFAGANEVIWRTQETDVWVWWSVADGWLAFAAIYGATWVAAWWWWDE